MQFVKRNKLLFHLSWQFVQFVEVATDFKPTQQLPQDLQNTKLIVWEYTFPFSPHLFNRALPLILPLDVLSICLNEFTLQLALGTQ